MGNVQVDVDVAAPLTIRRMLVAVGAGAVVGTAAGTCLSLWRLLHSDLDLRSLGG